MRAARDERAHVRGAQRGSVSDLEALFRTHWPRAYRAAYLVTHDAGASEDIAQESFLAAMRALDTFDRRRPSDRGCTGSSSTVRSTGRAFGAYGRSSSFPSPCLLPSGMRRPALTYWRRSRGSRRSTARSW